MSTPAIRPEQIPLLSTPTGIPNHKLTQIPCALHVFKGELLKSDQLTNTLGEITVVRRLSSDQGLLAIDQRVAIATQQRSGMAAVIIELRKICI